MHGNTIANGGGCVQQHASTTQHDLMPQIPLGLEVKSFTDAEQKLTFQHNNGNLFWTTVNLTKGALQGFHPPNCDIIKKIAPVTIEERTCHDAEMRFL